MSKVTLSSPVENIKGKWGQKDVIMRQKCYRAPNGAVLREGVQEAYHVTHPRDFQKTPPQGAEWTNMRDFGNISLLVSELIRAGKMTDEELAAMTPEEQTHVTELRTQLEDFRKRFYAQFKRPDPEAPLEKKLAPGCSTLRRRQYLKLDTFIQAILRERLQR